MFTVDITPAQWRNESNQYIVKRMGYVLINFFELDKNDMRIDGSNKKTFVVTLKNMDVILDLDTRAPFDEAESNEELMLYKKQDTAMVNILKIAKNADRTFTFTYCEMADGEEEDLAEGGGNDDENEIQSYNEITLKPGQVKMVQEVCKFAIPALTGMHAIYNPSLLE